MSPEKPSERALKIAQEAKDLLEATSKLGPGFEKRILDAMRRSAAKEVEHAIILPMWAAENNQREIELTSYPDVLSSTHPRIVVILAGPRSARERDGSLTYTISAHKMEMIKTSWFIAKLYEKGTMCSRVEDFKKIINELKASIPEGKLDKDIHLAAEQLIYDKMKETIERSKQNIPPY